MYTIDNQIGDRKQQLEKHPVSGKAVEKLWESCGKAEEKLWKSCAPWPHLLNLYE